MEPHDSQDAAVDSQTTTQFPSSFIQERLWFIDQLEPQSPLYNIYDVMELRGPLEYEALASSLQSVVDRHEILRTTFVAIDGHPWQAVASHMRIEIPLEDLSTVPEEQRVAEMERRIAEKIALPFTLNKGPLIRASLLRLSATDQIMIVVVHHTVSDQWSNAILWRELSAFYHAAISAEKATLPELTLQYADFAEWQRGVLQGPDLATQLAYWHKQLADAAHILELPTDFPRPAQFSHKGEHTTFYLPIALSRSLRTLAQREGVTIFMLMLAAFQTMLSRYSGQDDFVVGSPVAGRTRAELEPLIGPFVNTLTLRANLKGDPPFRELLRRVRETCLSAFEHQDTPLEKIIEDLNPERNPSYTPIFQVFFGLQYATITQQMLTDIELFPLDRKATTAKADLGLTITDCLDDLYGDVEFCTELFTKDTIARFIRNYRTLLDSIVANPDQQISQLALLSDTEQQRVLVEWNAGSDLPADTRSIVEMIQAQALATPDALAVQDDARSLTYAPFLTQATALAHTLRQQHGVQVGTRLGLALPRTVDAAVAFLGGLLAGATLVPLDPTYPADRLAFLCADAQVASILTHTSLRDILIPLGVPLLPLDTLDTAAVATDALPPLHPEQVAYVIYTSGSTGQPKGVAVSHRGLLPLVRAQIAAFGLTPASRVAQFASPSFDAAISELLTAWGVGATLCLTSETTLHDPQALVRWLAAQHITTITLPPSYLATVPVSDLPHLHTLVVAGEAASPALLAAWATPTRRLINAYGPTEATVCATLAVLPTPLPTPLPIGAPLPTAQVYVLDAQQHPVPIGVTGELYIGGLGVAQGYLHRPDLTAERFVPDPFGALPGQRLYRTGDQVRWLADGQLAYLGRSDTQVKVRGYRVEVEEIEAQLVQHPQVVAAAVVAREQRLVAYVVVNEGTVLAEGALTAFLSQRVPEYLVPSVYLPLARLPRLPNGKLDRRALQMLDALPTTTSSNTDYVAPRTPIETEVVAIWEQVLGVAPISVTANFFALGGHSLLATQVTSRIYDIFQLEIPLHIIFEEPTLAGFAKWIEQERAQTAVAVADEVPLARGARYHGLTQ